MDAKIISIAIPTYNMEQYLSRCLESLIGISNLDSAEIIVVNDGSSDASSEIAHRYAIKYPSSVVVIDKKNGNYGSCVNEALKIATGAYFRVLDADDWFDTKGFEEFIEKLRITVVDVAVTHFSKEFVFKKKRVEVKTSFKHFNEVIPVDSTLLNEVAIIKDFVMHKLTYRTELLRNIHYRQIEGISYTDSEYVYYPLMNVQSIIFFDIMLYRYFIGREGQTISIPVRIKHMNDMYLILDRIMGTTIMVNHNSFLYKVQLELLQNFFASYYWSVLVIQKLSEINENKLQELDLLLETWNKTVYLSLYNIKCLGVKYIYYWRKRRVQIIPYRLYCLFRKIFVS